MIVFQKHYAILTVPMTVGGEYYFERARETTLEELALAGVNVSALPPPEPQREPQRWVHITKCLGELEVGGWYLCYDHGNEEVLEFRSADQWFTQGGSRVGDPPSHVLNPHLGPIPCVT